MKYLILIALLVTGLNAFCQMPNINRAITGLDKALVDKDTVQLKKYLAGNVTYGHSNGWIQSRKDIIDDLYNGKLSYKNIESKVDELSVSRNTAFVRSTNTVEVEMAGKVMKFKLKVLQVWMLVDGRNTEEWQLFARQSVKI